MLPTMPATANHTMLTTLIQMFSTCMHRGVVPMFRNIKCGCILKSPKLEYSLQHVPLLELRGNMHSLARPRKSGHHNLEKTQVQHGKCLLLVVQVCDHSTRV